MQKVLIYKNDYAISLHKNKLDKMIPYIQEVYDEFLSVGVAVTLDELKPILYSVIRYDIPTQNVVEKFVMDSLIAKAGSQSFNGVEISIEKLINKPDLSSIIDKVSEYYNYHTHDSGGYTPENMELNDDVVSKTDTAFDEIENRFTYYSENDRGAEVGTMLFELAQRLNDAMSYLDVKFYSSQAMPDIFGLKRENLLYIPDLNFIRRQEKSFENYVATED